MNSQYEFETMQYCRWDMLNYIIKLYDYKSYLEIGAAAGYNFHQINCPYKVCVDPEKKFPELTHNITSDQFFENNHEKFDLIFIDGLHVSYQVYKDIENSLKVLNYKGTIMMHDCLPMTFEEQTPERTTWNWTGDVWRAFAYFRQMEDLFMFTVDTDHGLGIIKKGSQKPYQIPENLDFDYYCENVFNMMLPQNVVKAWDKLKQAKELGW